MSDHTQTRAHPASWAAALVGTMLFLFSGLALTLSEIPPDWAVPSWFYGLRSALYVGLLFLPALCLGIGWVKGFPRWSYPYVGFVLLVSSLLMNAATPNLQVFGYTFGRELWGWWAWVPFLVTTAIALLITRSLRPLWKLFANIWEDWTLAHLCDVRLPALVGGA